MIKAVSIELEMCIEPWVFCIYLTYCIKRCVKIFIMNGYISKSYTTTKNANLFCKDRPTPGGGVFAYVHSSIPTIRLENIEASDKEVLWLLHRPTRISRPFSCIITAALYFSPGKTCPEERELIDHITERLDNLLIERPSAGIIITEDFNHLNPRKGHPTRI